MSKAQKQLDQMKHLRIMITIVTVFCIGISVTLNVMHAPGNPMAQIVSGFPPVAAFFVIELIARIPGSNLWLTLGRIAGSLVVGGVAGSISYVQQIDYVERLGFVGWIALAFPAVIDGTMLVTTLSLVEVVRKVRQLEEVMDANLAPAAGVVVGVASGPALTAAGAANAGLPDVPAAQQEAVSEVKADDAQDPRLPAAPVSPAPAGTAELPAPPAQPGRPQIPVERDPDGVIVDKTTKRPVSKRTSRRVRNEQPARLDA